MGSSHPSSPTCCWPSLLQAPGGSCVPHCPPGPWRLHKAAAQARSAQPGKLPSALPSQGQSLVFLCVELHNCYSSSLPSSVSKSADSPCLGSPADVTGVVPPGSPMLSRTGHRWGPFGTVCCQWGVHVAYNQNCCLRAQLYNQLCPFKLSACLDCYVFFSENLPPDFPRNQN